MRFLADECCDFGMMKALRATGHDVIWMKEVSPGADDAYVVELALKERLILLTEDKDFGQLVYAHGQSALGVIFMRYPFEVRRRISLELVELVSRLGESLYGCFVTIQPGRSRIGRIPRG